MSAKVAEQQLLRFLQSPDPEVLCLKGAWGVGKTHAWQRLVNQAKTSGSLPSKNYSFISLYGINSIDELKASIVVNTVPPEQIGKLVTIDTIKNSAPTEAMTHWRKLIPFLSHIPAAGDLTKAIQQLSFLSIQNQFVCIDDIERKSDSLELKEIFGIATFLKDQRKCKVIIILNSNALNASDSNDFKNFFEKTIDTHIDFRPSPAEAATIAIPGQDQWQENLRRHFITLSVTNIRIMQRVERTAKQLRSCLIDLHPNVERDFIRSLAIMGWSKFSEDAPKLDFLKSRHVYGGNKKWQAEEDRWGTTLQNFGQWYYSDTGRIVLDSLECGYVDIATASEHAQQLHEGYQEKESAAAFHEAWDTFHGSFEDNLDEVIASISSAFKTNAQHISPANANGAVQLFRDFGKDQIADELIDIYVGLHSVERFDSERLFTENDVTDNNFRAAIEKKRLCTFDRRSPEEVLLAIGRNSSWNPEDIALLAKVDQQGYYDMFKTMNSTDKIILCGRQIAAFGRMITEDQNILTVARNAQAALRRIGLESPLNKKRVQRFGIKGD